jgi:hypothetical protein
MAERRRRAGEVVFRVLVPASVRGTRFVRKYGPILREARECFFARSHFRLSNEDDDPPGFILNLETKDKLTAELLPESGGLADYSFVFRSGRDHYFVLHCPLLQCVPQDTFAGLIQRFPQLARNFQRVYDPRNLPASPARHVKPVVLEDAPSIAGAVARALEEEAEKYIEGKDRVDEVCDPKCTTLYQFAVINASTDDAEGVFKRAWDGMDLREFSVTVEPGVIRNGTYWISGNFDEASKEVGGDSSKLYAGFVSPSRSAKIIVTLDVLARPDFPVPDGCRAELSRLRTEAEL